jgi:hypothetical protein
MITRLKEDHLMPEEITTHDAQYALDIVKAICSQVGPGIPGSPQERERAEMIKKELQTHLGAENVALEEFNLAPEAFLGSQLISTLCMLIAALLNISMGHFNEVSPWVTAIAAFTFSISSVLLFTIAFVIGFELLDPFFKKKGSINVVGTLRKPGTKNVKRLLILSGHHDSALEFSWLRYTGYGFFVLTITWMIALITVLVMTIIQLVGVITGNPGIIRLGTLGYILIAYPIVPSIIFAIFYARGRKNGGTVPGAADNLSACALVVAMCKFLVENPAYIPDDTEIRFITFGSEEAGRRGSQAYVTRHLDELKSLELRLLNFETIAHPEIAILTSETNGTVKNSPAMVKSVVAAAQRAGVPYKVKSAILGTASDAGPFSRACLKAITLVSFTTQQMVAFYHQKWDTPEVLSIEPLLNVLKLTFEWVRKAD